MTDASGPEQAWDFFIAHAGSDTDDAVQLYDALSRHARVFLDARSLHPGDSWAQVLPVAIRRSLSILVLVSSRTRSAYYQESEIQIALDRLRADPENFHVVPVLLDTGGPIRREELPFGLQQLVPISLAVCGGWSQLADKLLNLVFSQPALETDSAPLTDATTGFVGETQWGPTEPQFVESWTDFTRIFGDGLDTGHNYLHYSVRGFFENGGNRAVVCRVVGSAACRAAARIPTPDSQTTLNLAARWLGSYGNDIVVSVRPGSRAGIRITIKRGAQIEDFNNLAFGAGPNPLMERMSESELILTELSSAIVPESRPFGEWRLCGGTDGIAPSQNDYLGRSDLPAAERTGLAALTQFADIGLLCVPDAAHPRFSQDERNALTQAVLAHCEKTRSFAVLSAPSEPYTPDRLPGAPVDSSFGAIYFPWIHVPGLRPGTTELVPATGHVAGAYARCDRERGVHASLRGFELKGLVDGAELLPILEDECRCLGVNQIAIDPADPTRVVLDSGMTMAIDQEWQSVPVRRLFNFVERSIESGLTWTAFAPNDEATWREVALQIEDFLRRLWRTGALIGNRPEEAFFVRCDRSTMTGDDIANGRIVAVVGTAPKDQKLRLPGTILLTTLPAKGWTSQRASSPE